MKFAKEELRREARQRRDRIDPAAIDTARVIPLFMDAIKPDPDRTIGLYMAKGNEFNPTPLRDTLCRQNFPCALPVVQPNGLVLRFVSWRLGDILEPGPFNILQPKEGPDVYPDIIVLPLLAFDTHGNRLGYGSGYYDATLNASRKRKNIVAVGLCYEAQKLDYIPVEPHDERLDWIITPEKAYKFC